MASRHKANISGLIVWLVVFPFFTAFGANKTIFQSENGFNVGIGITHIGYGETVAWIPGYADTENGNLSTTTLEFSRLVDEEGVRENSRDFNLPPGFYLNGRISWATGATQYDGQTQDVPPIPVSTTDLADILKIDLASGHGFTVSPRLLLIPNVQVGTHYWGRTVQPHFIVNNVNYENKEDYRHYYFGIGLKSVYALVEKVAVSLALDLHNNFFSEMRSSYTGETYSLKNNTGYAVTGKMTYEAGKDVNFFVKIAIETFSYGASPVQADGTFEPDSKSQLVQYTVGAAHAF